MPFMVVGEEISGEWNAQALADIARTFGSEYLAYDGDGVAMQDTEHTPTVNTLPDQSAHPCVTSLLDNFDLLLAAENQPGAHNIYTYRPPVGSKLDSKPETRRALLMGNEAKGLRRRTLKRAQDVVEIPLVSKNINCLNVAAAAAVLLYYLRVNESLKTPLGQQKRTLTAVQKQRPDVLLIGGREPMELGSVVRSACAFGWERVFLEDRHQAWYDCDRLMKSEGRGAARRGRNPIKVIPCPVDLLVQYDRIVVIDCEHAGEQKSESNTRSPYVLPLTSRPAENVLIVLPDARDLSEPWSIPDDVRGRVVYADLPSIANAQYHYRQAASIGLAEVARQLGEPDGDGIYLRGKKQRYQKAMAGEAEARCFTLDDLSLF